MSKNKEGFAIRRDIPEMVDAEEEMDSIEEYRTEKESVKNNRGKFSQWSDVNGCIIPVSNTFDRLEAGYYVIRSSNDLGTYFKKVDVNLNEIYRLPNKASDIILDDISKFWTKKADYEKYKRVFRRNYLLYSAPGTGKTSLITLMCKELIEKYNGIVISLMTSDDIYNYYDAIIKLRTVEPERKIITIIEDIDNFIGDRAKSSMDTYLLNILDGSMKADSIVTIATTNYIEVVESRYKNRPSRFDRVVEFPLPNDASRKMFIEKSVMPEDIEKINIDEWVRRTKGYTIDHINELILLFFVFGHDEEESFKTVGQMVENNDTLHNKASVKKKTLGFGNCEEDDDYEYDDSLTPLQNVEKRISLLKIK